jgi:hypothetical protein
MCDKTLEGVEFEFDLPVFMRVHALCGIAQRKMNGLRRTRSPTCPPQDEWSLTKYCRNVCVERVLPSAGSPVPAALAQAGQAYAPVNVRER